MLARVRAATTSSSRLLGQRMIRSRPLHAHSCRQRLIQSPVKGIYRAYCSSPHRPQNFVCPSLRTQRALGEGWALRRARAHGRAIPSLQSEAARAGTTWEGARYGCELPQSRTWRSRTPPLSLFTHPQDTIAIPHQVRGTTPRTAAKRTTRSGHCKMG